MSTFNDSYLGTPPWDIGHPQREFVKLSESGEIKGDVIDVGCGTGEHAIFLASQGHRALGIDSAPRAIEKAKAKAKARDSAAVFMVADALRLGSLDRTFDTVVDCALFHVFPDRERAIYVKSLAVALKTGGRYFMLCFSDKEPDGWGGPRRVTKKEIEDSFSKGWKVDFIRRAKLESLLHQAGGEAWLSGMTKTGLNSSN